MRKRVLFFLLLTALATTTNSSVAWAEDKKEKQTPNQIWNLDVLGGVDFPAADMAKRFGTSFRIGPGIKLKTKKNWLFGAKFEFLTGNVIRDDSLLINVRTSQGGIISQNGDVLNVGTFLRGYTAGLQVGKILPFAQANINSGPMVLGTVGFMQYRINLFDRDNSFPAIRDDYRKGYDRLTNGLFLESVFGYCFYDRKKFVNFYIGYHILYGATQGRRDFLLDIARPDTGNRSDIMHGFKAAWVLPIYKKNVEDTYY